MVILLLITLIIVIGKAYVNENKFGVVTGNVTLENGAGLARVDYPEGFTKDNCVVISAGCQYASTGVIGFGFVQSTFGTGATLSGNKIAFVANSIDEIGPSGTYPFKVVLMKIN